MARCPHGFERSVIPCPDCGPLPTGTQRKAPPAPAKPTFAPPSTCGRERVYSDAEIQAALGRSSSIKEAAGLLECVPAVIYKRGRTNPQIRALLQKVRAPMGWTSRTDHPGLKDLTGQMIAGVIVIDRATNRDNGNAAWHCKLWCGCLRVIQGIYLRSRRPGAIIGCKEHGRPEAA